MTSQEVKASNTKSKVRRLWRPFLLIVMITVVLIFARVLGLDTRLGDLRDWIETLLTHYARRKLKDTKIGDAAENKRGRVSG